METKSYLAETIVDREAVWKYPEYEDAVREQMFHDTAKALRDVLEEDHEYVISYTRPDIGGPLLLDLLDRGQTAYRAKIDVTPLVRCKDCKYDPNKNFYAPCPMSMRINRTDKSFCSFGERREDEQIH